MLVCVVFLLEHYRKLEDNAQLPLISSVCRELNSRSRKQGVALVMSFFSVPPTSFYCSLPAFSLDHVKTPNKETDAPLLSSRSECYVVVVGIIIHLNASCQSDGGVALPLQGSCYSILVKRPFGRWRSVPWMRALAAETCLFLYWNINFFFFFFLSWVQSSFNSWITNTTRKQ